jgi:hypothetical protein
MIRDISSSYKSREKGAMYNTYDEVLEPRFHNEKIRLQCIVAGKSLAPYHIPKKVRVRCTNPKCKGCKLQNEAEHVIPAKDQTILTFIDVTTSGIAGAVRNALKVPCKYLEVKVDEVQLVERIYISRPTGQERTRKGGDTRESYIVNTSVETNSVYDLIGYTTVDPKTQASTHVFIEAKKMSSDVESFNLTHSKHKWLSKFNADGLSVKQLGDKLSEIYKSYSHNVTRIHHRADLHMSVDLLYRSVITFNFDGEHVHKGWMEAMIIGDTRCGKGYVVERLVDYFGLGEVTSGKNTSFSGLVGGVQQFEKRWVIKWGKIPMNDCGLLVVDETSGIMEADIWGKLTRIRSEGIAEITKIHTSVANARTRLLYLCNPMNRTISSYSYGIQAVSGLIKAPEDISRFDYVLVVAHNEVKGEEINVRNDARKSMYDKALEQELILWCWSRKEDEVKFTQEAISEVYKLSLELGKLYDFTIPLIQVENVRFKLAKLAIAFSARFYSNMENGRILLVRKVHVECAFGFFGYIYGKEASGYLAFSAMQKSSFEVMTPEKLREIDNYFNSWKLNKNELLRCLLVNNNINAIDIVTHLACSDQNAIECVSRLLRAGCLTKKVGYYVKTPDFTAYLKRQLLSKKLNRVIDEDDR